MLFADDMVLLAPSVRDLQLSLDQFAADCEAARMKISISKSETMVLSRTKVECLLWVGEEILPQVEEFKYLGFLFTSEDENRARDRQPDRCGVHSDAGSALVGRGVEGFHLPDNLRSYPYLWSQTLGIDPKERDCRENELHPQGGWTLCFTLNYCLLVFAIIVLSSFFIK